MSTTFFMTSLYSLTYMPRVKYHISEWSDRVCIYLTSFNNADLRKIYVQFDLARLAGADGYVRVTTGHTNQRGTPCFYRERMPTAYRTEVRADCIYLFNMQQPIELQACAAHTVFRRASSCLSSVQYLLVWKPVLLPVTIHLIAILLVWSIFG